MAKFKQPPNRTVWLERCGYDSDGNPWYKVVKTQNTLKPTIGGAFLDSVEVQTLIDEEYTVNIK